MAFRLSNAITRYFGSRSHSQSEMTRVALAGGMCRSYVEGLHTGFNCNGVWHMLQASQQDAVCPAARFYANTAQSSGKAGNQSEAQTDRPLNPHDQRLGEFADTMLVDTLALMKSFESSGLDREQAEAITRHVTQLILSQSSHNLSLFTTKSEMQRVIVTLDSKQQQHKQEMQVAHEVYSGAMNKEAERLSGQLAAFKSDIKHDVDKLTANQKLDLNLERGRLRDDLQLLRDKLTTLRTSLEREVNIVRTEMESSKSDILKWVIVTVVGLLGAGFAAIRLAMA